MVMVDRDDPVLGGYLALPWPCMIGERSPLSRLYNRFFARFPDLDWYGFLADDVLPETPGWDRILIETAGKDGLAFGADGINGGLHAAHFVLGGDLVREYGFLSLPGLSRLYIDTVWNDIARERGVFRYVPDVKLTHLHFSNGKALFDSVYRKPDRAHDREIYNAWRTHDRKDHGE